MILNNFTPKENDIIVPNQHIAVIIPLARLLNPAGVESGIKAVAGALYMLIKFIPITETIIIKRISNGKKPSYFIVKRYYRKTKLLKVYPQ